jgi:hypothetical protein
MTILTDDMKAIMKERFKQCGKDEVKIGEVYDDLYFGYRTERGSDWMKKHWQQVARELTEVELAANPK